jgi:uncharacterized protein YcbK (DUF882 family)
MTQLTASFSLKELTVSETAVRKGLDNTPNETVTSNLKTLCENILQPVRDHYGKAVKVNSGYRSPEVNASVGGSKTSDHCKGQAADIEISGVANGDLAKYIAGNFEFTQVILEFYTQGVPESGWVHVSYDPQDLKCQCLTAVKEKGKTVYTPGLIV